MQVTPLRLAFSLSSVHTLKKAAQPQGVLTHLVPDVIICLLNHIGVVVIEVTARQEAIDCLLVGVTARSHRLTVRHLEARLGGGVEPVVPARSILLKHSWELTVSKAKGERRGI